MKIIAFIIFLIPAFLNAQKNDFVWLLGYGYSLTPNDTFGISVMDFNTQSLNPKIYFDKNIKFDYSGTSICMSDESGTYIFTTDGNTILNSNNELMMNAEKINPSDNLDSEVDPQSCIVLPISNYRFYSLINNRIDIVGNSVASVQSFLSIIDINGDNGLGNIVHSLIKFSNDTLSADKLTSTRHANGRDWWLPIPGYNTDIIYSFLVQDTSVRLVRKQKVDSIIYNGYGQAVFSQNGEYYANISSISTQQGTYIYLFSFDRCTGELYFIKSYHLFPAPGNIGLSFSPDSKTLYVGFGGILFRVDLNSQLKNLDTAAVNDNYIEDIGGGFSRYNPFGLMQLGPDLRIYCSPTTESRNFHVINRPNKKSDSTDIRQHSLHVASLKITLPIHPNYRLGPLDGSPCDTLGIDNIPVAEFRYDQDTSNYLQFEFTDLSYHEPKEWHWNFGDPASSNNTSTQINPMHLFSTNGIFYVCLTVKNQNGSDIICKLINIGTLSSVYQGANIPEIDINPNPFKEIVIINLNDYNPQRMVIQIYNFLGEVILSQRLFQGSNLLDFKNKQSGLYHFGIFDNGCTIKSGKLIKL